MVHSFVSSLRRMAARILRHCRAPSTSLLVLRCLLGFGTREIFTRHKQGLVAVSIGCLRTESRPFSTAVGVGIDAFGTAWLGWLSSKTVGAWQGIDVEDDFLLQMIGRPLVAIPPEFEPRVGDAE